MIMIDHEYRLLSIPLARTILLIPLWISPFQQCPTVPKIVVQMSRGGGSNMSKMFYFLRFSSYFQ